VLNNAQLSEIITSKLELSHFPVSVSFFAGNDNPRLEKLRPTKPLPSYCHAVMSAARGESFYLLKKDILCRSGAATLGFSGYSEDMLLGRKHYKTGVFGCLEAAQKAVAGAYKLQDGKTKAVLIRPLPEADNDYQVILIPANPEQIMILMVADKYETGGRTEISMATGFQGVCGDATVYVLQTGRTNFSVTGFGDRLRSGLEPELSMVGIPKERVTIIARNLEALGENLLAKYKGARTSRKVKIS
jgi:uncharacterized protein (DUF169 family)